MVKEKKEMSKAKKIIIAILLTYPLLTVVPIPQVRDM
jgi:hypothetical protein